MKRRTIGEIKQDLQVNLDAMGKDEKIKSGGNEAIPMCLNYQGKMMILTAELSEISSHKIEVLTAVLIGLTAVLAVFTWMLVKHGC